MEKTLEKILETFITFIGGFLGNFLYKVMEDWIVASIRNYPYVDTEGVKIVFHWFLVILFGLIFFYLAPYALKISKNVADYLQNRLSKMPFPEFIGRLIGFVVGIFIAYLVSNPISKIPVLGIPLAVVMYIFLGYVGINLGKIKKDEILKYSVLKENSEEEKKKKSNSEETVILPKILDTSVIIDGRIKDIINTGFIEGTIVIPTFVLDELRYIADSSDDLKRTKGRRGLDILNEIQASDSIDVLIDDKNKFEDVNEVDVKLLKLAKKLGGSVLTNDYNLNKVAKIQNIKILNINELSNAVKPRLVVGEKLIVKIVKDGKEQEQGIGYLDDGTMIVVENGRDNVGEVVETEVSSVLQTPAGRMIFTRINK